MALLVAVATAVALAHPSGASGKILAPWGSNLTATPTLDTANGASHATGGHSTQHAIVPNPHDGADLAVWNRATAPRGGQVRQVRIRGCAIRDPSAPSQLSAGTPVNTINFLTLTHQGNGFKAAAAAPRFKLPFCSSSADPAAGAVNTGTITTFQPVHLCIGKGQSLAFEDIGGFIPGAGGGLPWYPEGVPFDVIAPVAGSAMDSFADAEATAGVFAPGLKPAGLNSGFGTEPGEQLMLQAVEGTGADAYGLCPGGTADEPASSNEVICVYIAPYDRHRRCR